MNNINAGNENNSMNNINPLRDLQLGHVGLRTKQCPRCHSWNTKFGYYNNYSLNQPRHYCRTCRRHWTIGGAFRHNVPTGGARRRNSKKRNKVAPAPQAKGMPLLTASAPNVPMRLDNFSPCLWAQPLSNGGAWQHESLFNNSISSEQIFSWGLDHGASGSGTVGQGGGIGELPPVTGIDSINNSQWIELLDFNIQPPPLPPSA